MALSNAERQRRHRERLKARAAGADILDRLNTSYAEGHREGLEAALERCGGTICEHEEPGAWAALAAGLRDLEIEPQSVEQWLRHARESGEKMGEHLVLTVRRDHLLEVRAARDAAAPPPEPKPKRRR